MDYIALAEELGFTAAAIMNASDLVVIPEYRRYCRENRCGNYDLLPACPPKSGSVEEMSERIRQRSRALVLQYAITPAHNGSQELLDAKKHANVLTEKLMDELRRDGHDNLLMMGAGPWKKASCMSAYCVDAQKMADSCHMECWADDGRVRFFSLLLY